MLDIATARAPVAESRPERHPDAVRQQVTVLARALVAKGQTCSSVARRLGLHRGTVARWLKEEEGGKAGFVPVEVAAEASTAALTIVSPGGYRLEGLGFEAALAALSRLG